MVIQKIMFCFSRYLFFDEFKYFKVFAFDIPKNCVSKDRISHLILPTLQFEELNSHRVSVT
jgi:hypothetical protein